MLKKKAILVVMLCMLFSWGAFAQCRQGAVSATWEKRFDTILAAPVFQELLQLEPEGASVYSRIMIHMDFACSQIKDTTGIHKLTGAQVVHVDYIHSAFKTAESFQQKVLDKERLFQLQKVTPALFEDNNVSWTTIVQTHGKTSTEAEKLFHGFIIYYIPRPSEELTKIGVRYIDEMLKTLDPDHKMSGYSEKVVVSSRRKYDKGRSGYYIVYDTTIVSVDTLFGDARFYTGDFSDTVIAAAFNRNAHWKDMLVVSDLTGSMYPYTAQLFRWYKLNADAGRIKHVVFFNDGDETADRNKIIGSTGGLYHSGSNDFDTLLDLAKTCMENGGGGDVPENDLEAVLAGLDSCPSCTQVVLIADNLSNMRDYSLITQLNRPVTILLCGTQFGINPQYLNLARQTKGSVHTMEGDMLNLSEVREGEEVQIGSGRYQLREGRFIKAEK